MNNKTDSEEHNSLPDDLYRAYRRQRSTTDANRSPAEAGSSVEGLNLQSTDDELANKAYHHYKSNRSRHSPADESLSDDAGVDEIVKLIMQDQSNITADNNAPLDTQVVESGSPRTGKLEWLKQSHRAANDSNPNTKTWLGVAAAIILGIALLPLFNSQQSSISNSLSRLPAELAENADQFTPHIQSGDAGSIGFSSGIEQTKQAFQYGVLVTDVMLYEQSQNKSAATELVRHYLSTTSGVDTEIERVLTQYSEQNGTNIDELLATITQQVKQSDTQQWFDAGQSVESIVLASRHALATSDSEPLKLTMDRARTLSSAEAGVVNEDSPLNKLFVQLLEHNLGDNDNFRSIARDAEQIKSLMQ